MPRPSSATCICAKQDLCVVRAPQHLPWRPLASATSEAHRDFGFVSVPGVKRISCAPLMLRVSGEPLVAKRELRAWSAAQFQRLAGAWSASHACRPRIWLDHFLLPTMGHWVRCPLAVLVVTRPVANRHASSALSGRLGAGSPGRVRVR